MEKVWIVIKRYETGRSSFGEYRETITIDSVWSSENIAILYSERKNQTNIKNSKDEKEYYEVEEKVLDLGCD